ncbi:hypothetical protein PHLGIDRAFT_14539 [Phlebiopsis gigantea 11061_1 CR5-6]|uniref:Protein SMG7 n=1 Tax=Phlebiopsis gigantea (strain 11061_1 CR5-6) TaxID=745531 RepID=A0A0C3PHS0_PHLG1|nr:hypothetical protein PHLGIDRAFT_14539 [Phlebiopsis gigantea 11061_1 CR5-6]
MSDVAAQIAREAKALQQGLKESLKNRDITDREIDIQRKNLRRQYLRLLFLHPYARESKDAETHLWMQTSYSIIAIYKQRIAALDRALHNPSRQGGQQHSTSHNRTVEYRKLLQRFRQFLAEEEKFWMQLVLRLRRYFALDDAQSALTALGITPEDDQTPAVDGAGFPRRNQHQFPPESDVGDGQSPMAPTTAAQREGHMAILSKALVCLGDIARYKEQYNEAGGRPRAGHEDGPPAASAGRGGRGRRGGAPGANHPPLPRLRNYDRAQSCYEQARLMLPHDGNPSHQLAILSSYQKDILSCIVHYYRALCVRSPYETASENLGTVLHRALEQYKTKGLLREAEVQEELSSGATIPPRLRVESFKEKVIVLHAQWFMNMDDAKSMGERVVEEFAALVTDRILPIEMISKIIILVQGALWKHRMVRRPSNAEKRSSRLAVTESHIVTHLIAAHRVLLENGIVELAEAPPEDAAEGDLAQRITATFRRTLPALRMAGKWLRSNTRYLSQSLKSPANGGEEVVVAKDSKGRDRRGGNSVITVDGICDFWREYARFSTSLINAFPVESLPKLMTQLEEDVDMAGFLPLRKYMVGSDGQPLGPSRHIVLDNVQPAANVTDLQDPCAVHPNEEQLMRIADILVDAKAVAEDEFTPVSFAQGHITLNPSFSISGARSHGSEIIVNRPARSNGAEATEPSHSFVRPARPPPATLLPFLQKAPEEDDTISVTTRTDDDPVGEAFKLPALDDDDEEVIVYQPSAPLSPRQDPIINGLPITPPRQRPDPIGSGYTPRRLEPLSPPFVPLDMQRSPPTAAASLMTAQDLLKTFIGTRHPSTSPHHQRTASSPPVNLIPGSSTIWSTDATSLPYPSGNRTFENVSRPAPHYAPLGAAPLPPTQSPWPPQTSWQSATSSSNATQLGYGTGLHHSLVQQQSSLMNSGHHRIPSESLVPPRTNLLPPPTIGATRRYDPLDSAGSVNSVPIGSAYGLPGGGINDRLAAGGYADVFPQPAGHAGYYQGGGQPDLFQSGSAFMSANEQAFVPQYDGAQPVSRIWGSTG